MPVASGVGSGRCRCGIARRVGLHGVDDAVLGFRFARARRLRRVAEAVPAGVAAVPRCPVVPVRRRCWRCRPSRRSAVLSLRAALVAAALRRGSGRARCRVRWCQPIVSAAAACAVTASPTRRPGRAVLAPSALVAVAAVPRIGVGRWRRRRPWRWPPQPRRRSLQRRSPAARSLAVAGVAARCRSGSVAAVREWRSATASAVTSPCHPASRRSDRSPQRRRRKMLVDARLGRRRTWRVGLRRVGFRFGAAGRVGLGVGIGVVACG